MVDAMVGPAASPRFKVIGTRPIRPDGYEKVTGKAIYGGDVRVPGMVWGEVLRSPYAHARIRSIDTSAALKMPGVLAAVTHSDLPAAEVNEVPFFERVFVRPVWTNIRILARDKALYKGHAVAAVAAIDRNTALEALKRVKVEYEPLNPVLNVDEAVAPGAPIIMEDLVGDDLGKRVPNTNVAWHFRYEFGDADKAFKQCSLVVEREVSLQMVHQGYIEPHNVTAIWDADGRITVWASTQGAFPLRAQLAGILRVPESLIRVMPVEIGGGFGGKTHFCIYMEPLAAILSRKTRLPVKMLMDRKSIFEGTGPAHGGKVRVKLGVNDRGWILAGEAELRFESGGIPGAWVDCAANCIFSAYNIPNSRIDGYDIVVNKPKTAPYRAPGVPQAAFAMEQVVDELCEKGGWDKIDFRMRNASREGTRRADGAVIFGKIGLKECLEAARNSAHWKSRLQKKGPNGRIRGRGIAVGYMWQAGGKSAVDLTVGSDGVVRMNEGSVDIGGTRASIAMQAAEVLGISAEDVRPTIPDTDNIGFTGTTGGSRTANATGLAAYR
ncbi:MAG: xanthine dehydrogenase family protein molybdopterin-binding subunit, partial [Chloroflexi bacterium]|nr:xanthine dehydrogenase family protein molybdopterin-binding subunit [Chloroflexota bacterium]